MDEVCKNVQQEPETKNVLPDVVHSEQATVVEITAVGDQSRVNKDRSKNDNIESESEQIETLSESESISEHISAKIEYSVSESDVEPSPSPKSSQSNVHSQQLSHFDDPVSTKSHSNLRSSDRSSEHSQNVTDNLLSVPQQHGLGTGSHSILEPSHESWNASDVHISEESPVVLASSDLSSRDATKPRSLTPKPKSPIQSPQSVYLDSLNESTSEKSNYEDENILNKDLSLGQCSSGSEEIIKLDIRGQGVPKFQIQASKIIFGPPPDNLNTLAPGVQPIPLLENLLSPCLVSSNENVHIEEIFDADDTALKDDQDKSLTPASTGSSKIEQDVLVEEILVEDITRENTERNYQETSKFFIPDENISYSTLSTDYRTICEEYHGKLLHLEEAITDRDKLIEELKFSLQRTGKERDSLRNENDHLTCEVQNLQHIISERPSSDHDTVKGQLSDFIKYQSMLKDDSTRFYSALMSSSTSLQSSNGEKDMDREEITVDHSKSDSRSSRSSEEFERCVENKLTVLLHQLNISIEENLANKLKESLIQIISDEENKLRIEYETNMKKIEIQMQQETHKHAIEMSNLRELLSSVKSGSADIEKVRQELKIKHEEDMNDLKKYFVKKCADVEKNFAEDVLRSRSCASPTDDGAGDARPHCRSLTIEFPNSLSLECEKLSRKYEQQIEELKGEHVAYVNDLQARHKETIVCLEEQILQLKAHIQTAENTEASEYPQDIDLELEKGLRARDEHVRKQTLRQLERELLVLLEDPHAELSSWPQEMVALRDKIQGSRAAQETEEKECSSLREESPGDSDRWRQRRNNSFDQNRQLEDITRERDDLRQVATTLQRAVSQLAAYCVSADDELNHTVLARLLAHFAPHDDTFEESRPGSPSADPNTSVRRVHFAPDLRDILAALDESGAGGALGAGGADAVGGYLRRQRDLSADLKSELDHSLRRLRAEAHELLELSARLALSKGRNESKMIESSPVKITELVEDFEKHHICDNCNFQKKSMEEAITECLEREALLRAERDAAMLRVAQLSDERSSDVIEGYGAGAGELGGMVGGAGGSRSLESARSPREQLALAARDMDALLAERDDLRQQLEAASSQLRSTRQFVEEQVAEREAERDEFEARLADLREDNARLAARLHTNARILAEVEHLENQTREMNHIIADLETRKTNADGEVKAAEEKITLLRDVIANLESQLEQKTTREAEVLEQLEEMKKTIDERDSKMRALLGELESLRSEKAEQTDFICTKCAQEEEKYSEYVEKVKEEAARVAAWVARRRRRLERAYDHVSPPTSDLTEDVSLPDRRALAESPERGAAEEAAGGAAGAAGALCAVWEALRAQARAADAALKRIADLEMQRAALKDLAQEVRAERDVLQARMSEQALRISSLSARLQQQRHDADALAQTAASQLGVQLHDAHAEVQRLKEELESKDKQLARLRQNSEERDKCNGKHQPLYGNSKEKVVILEKELSDAQSKIAHLEELAQGLEMEKERLESKLRDQQRTIADKEEQLNEIMALKLEGDQNQKSEVIDGKASARTLSDIVSISEYDENDVQMRRAEMKNQSNSFTDEDKDKLFNKTLPPDVQPPNMSSLHVDFVDHFDFKDVTPHADSLPVYLTSTQNKDTVYKRNVNEMTAITTIDKLADSLKLSQSIPDNCSIFPNRNISDSKNISVEPKKINFSLEPSDNKTHDEEEFPSLQELGITIDVKQENFPDILTQLKHEIKKAKSELEICKSELKNAEEQLCEFPALKKEVEELKTLLDNTVATMENDKKFYENQLESFSLNKKLLEQRLAELTREAGEKSKDLHLLKEDILRRENMILELAKEKRNLTSKISELESKIEDLQNKNASLEKYELENKQMKEKINELQKLEQLVSEKNQQIDSLNQHLDRLDDLQRRLNDKNEELENLKESLEEKTNELFQMQDSVNALNSDIAKVVEENDQLSDENKELKIKLSKIEKERENASIKLQNSDSEVERLNSLNNELSSRIEELKQLNDTLKDKQTEIEILHEDIDLYHNEIALLKEQLKMISRSPSPRNKIGEEKRTPDRQAANDKKQLMKIKKQISLLQHELDFNKKDLNDKAFELAKAKLDLTEMKANLSQATKTISEKEANNTELQRKTENLLKEINKLKVEKQHLSEQLGVVVARLREESNVAELKTKLREQTERCQDLEVQLMNMKELVDRQRQAELVQERALSARSPTAELERAVRDQLNYSHALDNDMMEHILSASSDEREDIPRLALNTSRSSSVHSSSSERLHRLRSENEKLEMQVNNLECRLSDKDALIAELNRVRDQLSSELQCAQLRYEAERDNCARLMLLLDSQKDSAEAVRQQDSSVISLLQRRLESAMRNEAELQQRERAMQRARPPPATPPAHAPHAPHAPHADLVRAQMESEQLRSSVSVLQAKVELERRRNGDLQAQLEAARVQASRDAAARDTALASLRGELAELRRLKRESCVELARCRELLRARAAHERVEIDATNVTPRRRTEVDSPDLTRLKGQQRPTYEEKEQAIRYLQGRCLVLESYRKALVWQKRYLQKALAGYEELERRLSLASTETNAPRGLKRFKSVAWCAVAALRMRYVAARRQRQRTLSTDCLLRARDACSSPLTPVCRDTSALRLRRDSLLSAGAAGDVTRARFAIASPREPALDLRQYKLEVNRCLSRTLDAARDVP